MIFGALEISFLPLYGTSLKNWGCTDITEGSLGIISCCKKLGSTFRSWLLLPVLPSDLRVDHYNFWSGDLHHFITASKFLLLSFQDERLCGLAVSSSDWFRMIKAVLTLQWWGLIDISNKKKKKRKNPVSCLQLLWKFYLNSHFCCQLLD